MNIGIIGSGGREHALSHFLYTSKKVTKIFCIPGNAGTSSIAENLSIDLTNFEEIKKTVIKNKIDFIIVGPEKPLVDGLVDFLKKNNIKVFGPNKVASQLEGSKIFTKELCKKYNIPTAKFGIYKTFEDANNFLKNASFPLVIKADGLASGKGVYIPENKKEGAQAVKEIFDGKFGKAEKILIEEFLDGEEMSYFIISDGKNYKKFQTAQDHKRVFEGDTGKNTGGMGAYSPSKLINNELENKILKKIIEPTLKGLNDLGSSYEGFLYAGLMIKKNEPYLIEYNVRMGDPECQTILPLLKSDFGKILVSCCDGNLSSENIEWFDKKSLCIVLCSDGYPGVYAKKVKLNNVSDLEIKNGQYVIHAGTKYENKELFATGGRVLNIVVTSNSFENSKNQALKILNKINWKEGFYRKDIGYKVTSV